MQAVSKIISRFSGLLLFAMLILSAPSCGVYSFTGASIPPEAKTISIAYFQNNALLVEPLLSDEFTNAFRDRFMSQTSLNMVSQNGDLAFEGEITDYRTTPVAIQSDQTAALNRLEIKVNVRFTNKYDESTNFETQFTQYKEYPPGEQDFNAVKTELITEIIDLLVDDIFNKSVVNW